MHWGFSARASPGTGVTPIAHPALPTVHPGFDCPPNCEYVSMQGLKHFQRGFATEQHITPTYSARRRSNLTRKHTFPLLIPAALSSLALGIPRLYQSATTENTRRQVAQLAVVHIFSRLQEELA